MTESNRNESELLFEEYLTLQGHTDWTHEAPLPGKRKNPDYRLEYSGAAFFFEVKEFDSTFSGPGFGAYDPYGPIREKINQATRQFKEYKQFSCSVVLANPRSVPLIHLDDPWKMYGAMFGNVGFRVQLGVKPDENHPIERVFVSGGKMVDDKRKQPQNTTISAIIALSTFPLRNKQVEIAVTRRQEALDRVLTTTEILECYEAIPDSPDLRRVRVLVYENPSARIPLSRDLFCGAFDQRWGLDGESIRRVFVGNEIAAIEEGLGES